MSTTIPIADDFAAVAAGMRKDTPADSETLITPEQMAALEFPAVPFDIGKTREEWLADFGHAYDEFRYVEGVLKLDDVALAAAAAGHLDDFTTLHEVLADRAKQLKVLGQIAGIAEIRLLVVLTRLVAA